MSEAYTYKGLDDFTPRQIVKVLKRYSKGGVVKDDDFELVRTLASMNLIRFGMDHNNKKRTAMTTDMGCSFIGR